MMCLRRKLKVFRNWLGQLRAHVKLKIGFALEAKDFYGRLCHFNASVDTDHDMIKMQYTLLRESHVLEKGLSMKEPRLGFGQAKAQELLMRIDKYYGTFGHQDREFCFCPLNTICAYLDYQKRTGADVSRLTQSFLALCRKIGHQPQVQGGGTREIRNVEIQKSAASNFPSLLASRHSIRYFDQRNLPARTQIERALELAQRTPSACNRQAWHTHVYQGAASVGLAKWQGGCRGFEDEMTSTILVTADLKGFLWHEVHQAYVDGGLYAMNLINAIHALGMGTIPLSLGFSRTKLKELRRFGIPENEVPIVIIGFGNLLPVSKVAISARKPLSRTNVYHEEVSV